MAPTSLAIALLWAASAAAFAPPPIPRHRAAALRATPCDAAMYDTYDALAERCAALVEKASTPVWVGIAGGPGAGKSTVAAAVAQRCEARGVAAVVLPMDGYHFSKAELRALDPPDAAAYLPRRGAPWTFDAERFSRDVSAARATNAATWPTYSRELSDPVPGGAELEPRHALVLCEGNYLLLGGLEGSDDPAVAAEASRWRPVFGAFDETWFVAPESGVAAQRARLVRRHLETWTDEKTAAWGAATALEGAEKRTDANDVPNAELIDACRPFADLAVVSLDAPP